MKSSFQELMELVARDIESKDETALVALLEKLVGLRESFQRDRDLLEAVILRVERQLRAGLGRRPHGIEDFLDLRVAFDHRPQLVHDSVLAAQARRAQVLAAADAPDVDPGAGELRAECGEPLRREADLAARAVLDEALAEVLRRLQRQLRDGVFGWAPHGQSSLHRPHDEATHRAGVFAARGVHPLARYFRNRKEWR
jgi:hypothetical protein